MVGYLRFPQLVEPFLTKGSPPKIDVRLQVGQFSALNQVDGWFDLIYPSKSSWLWTFGFDDPGMNWKALVNISHASNLWGFQQTARPKKHPKMAVSTMIPSSFWLGRSSLGHPILLSVRVYVMLVSLSMEELPHLIFRGPASLSFLFWMHIWKDINICQTSVSCT